MYIAKFVKSRPKLFGREYNLIFGVLDTLFNLVDNLDNSAAGDVFESNPAGSDVRGWVIQHL